MNDIVIVGTGGFGREVAWLIEDINREKKSWNLLGFVDNTLEVGAEINGYKVLGNDQWLCNQELNVVIAIGSSTIRKKIVQELKNSKNKYPTLIHPSVIKSNDCEIGEGTIVCAGSIITVDVKIGNHVVVYLQCTICHDTIIKDYVTILPGVNVSGNVIIEHCTSVGAGSVIIQGIEVGENTIIGAGSVVVKNLPSECTAVGSPARPIKFNNE